MWSLDQSKYFRKGTEYGKSVHFVQFAWAKTEISTPFKKLFSLFCSYHMAMWSRWVGNTGRTPRSKTEKPQGKFKTSTSRAAVTSAIINIGQDRAAQGPCTSPEPEDGSVAYNPFVWLLGLQAVDASPAAESPNLFSCFLPIQGEAEQLQWGKWKMTIYIQENRRG